MALVNRSPPAYRRLAKSSAPKVCSPASGAAAGAATPAPSTVAASTVVAATERASRGEGHTRGPSERHRRNMQKMRIAQTIGNAHQPIPQRLFCKVHACLTVIGITSQGMNPLTNQYYILKLNDPYAPFGPSGSATRADYFTELGAFYYSYRCYGGSISVQANVLAQSSVGINEAEVPVVVSVLPAVTSAIPGTNVQIPASWEDARVMPGIKYKNATNFEKSVYVNSKYTISDYVGGSIENADEYMALASGSGQYPTSDASPPAALYWVIQVWDPYNIPMTSVDIGVNIDVTFDIEFFAPVRGSGYKVKDIDPITGKEVGEHMTTIYGDATVAISDEEDPDDGVTVVYPKGASVASS